MNFRNSILTLFIFVPVCGVFAQTNIVEKLQVKKAGEGEVVIKQDSRITSLIGNIHQAVKQPVKINVDNADIGVDDASLNAQPVEHKTIKARGYRLQVYAGNNSRVARNEANAIAEKVKQEFPEIPVYTYFLPPRWLCRIGDFRSIEEADAMMRRFKATGVFKEVSIVKEQINIPID